jgi:hypothetical protein
MSAHQLPPLARTAFKLERHTRRPPKTVTGRAG